MKSRAHRLVDQTKMLWQNRPAFWIATALCLAAFALYWRTMAPTVLAGDGGEFQYMAFILGVPHSSGYPLYVLLAKLFTFIPLGDVAFRVNLFSVVCAALAVPIIYALARRLIHRRAPAILATLLLAVTPSLWGGAVDPKPYALHFLLGVLAIFLAVRWHQDHRQRDFYGLAFVFGLGLANHHIIVFIAPALALVVWFNHTRLDRLMILRGALLTILPLLLYAYIPIRANQLFAQRDPANYQIYPREDAILEGTVTAYYNNTVQGFLSLITGLDNSYKLGFNSPGEATNRFDLAATLLVQQFGIAGIALIVFGAVILFRRDRSMFALLLAVAAGVGFIAIYLRGVSTVYYFSLCYLALALWIGFGMDDLMCWSERVRGATTSRIIRAFSSPGAVAAVLLLLPISTLVANFASLDESDNYAPRDYAQAVLNDHLPQNAVLIAPWEVAEPIRYLQFVENQRTDLLVINVSPVWTKQFETMLTNARAQHRPFYDVEFNPEMPAAGPRSVQAVPLPLLQEPQPRHVLNDTRIIPQVQILGYDLEPALPQPGKPTRVLIYYRVLERMYPMYSDALSISDINGNAWGDYKSFPASFYYPTYRWQVGDYYRDAFTIYLPTSAPTGLYNLGLSWYVYNSDTSQVEYDTESKLSLGAIRVGDFAPDEISHAQNAHIGDSISFLGWNVDRLTAERGQALRLGLVWRADRAVTQSYTVFVHLTDANGRVYATADGPPFHGLFPTDLWIVGEKLLDPHTLTIPANLKPGTFYLEVGMYVRSSGARLPIETEIDRSDKIVLTPVNVR